MELNRRALTQTIAKLAITPFKFIKAQIKRVVSGRFEQWVRPTDFFMYTKDPFEYEVTEIFCPDLSKKLLNMANSKIGNVGPITACSESFTNEKYIEVSFNAKNKRAVTSMWRDYLRSYVKLCTFTPPFRLKPELYLYWRLLPEVTKLAYEDVSFFHVYARLLISRRDAPPIKINDSD